MILVLTEASGAAAGPDLPDFIAQCRQVDQNAPVTDKTPRFIDKGATLARPEFLENCSTTTMTGKFMRASIIILLVFWSANANAEGVGKNKYEAPSLCAARDKIFFSCKTKKLKTISLCGQKNEGSVRRLYYRYGKPDKIELEYPKGTVSNKDSLTLFYYNHYTRWLVDYYTITFRNYGYVYVLQDLRSMEEKNDPHITQNIAVYVHPKYDEATDIPCASDVISDLYPLVNVIPCDKENALGCEK